MRRRLLQNFRDLAHFNHEGGLAAGQVVARADAGEDAVHHADAGGAGGNERANLCHERDERDLTHIGGFTRHIGARNDGDAVFLFAHVGVVRHKEGILQHALDDRVPSVVDLDRAGIVHHRAAVVVFDRDDGKRREGIKLRDRGGGLLDALGIGADLVAQGGEQLVFERVVALARGQDLLLQVLELLRDVALAVDERLLADVGLGHLILEGVGDLDVVAEDLVVADLQRADAGALLFLRLDGGEQPLAAGEDVVQAVDLGVEALADEAALAHGKRRIVYDGLGDARGDVRERVELLRKLAEPAGGEVRELRAHGGELFDGITQRDEVAPARRAVDDAADKPLHVANAGEGEHQLLTRHCVVHQRADGIRTARDGRDLTQGTLQPGPQASRAHGGFRFVEHPEQAPALFLAADGLRQLQIAAGGEVQLHEAALLVVFEIVDVG